MAHEAWRQPQAGEGAEETWNAEFSARVRFEDLKKQIDAYLAGPASEQSDAKTQLLTNGLDASLTEITNAADSLDFTLRDQILTLKERLGS